MIILTKQEQEELAKQLLELQQLLYKELFDKDSETAKAFDIISDISKEIIEPEVIKKVLKEQINSAFGLNKKDLKEQINDLYGQNEKEERKQ